MGGAVGVAVGDPVGNAVGAIKSVLVSVALVVVYNQWGMRGCGGDVRFSFWLKETLAEMARKDDDDKIMMIMMMEGARHVRNPHVVTGDGKGVR